MIRFILNQHTIETTHPEGLTVLDFVRYQQHLTGTKIGCREGDCGACTILVGTLKDTQMTYQSMTSCLMPLKNAHGKHIVTIEGINCEHLTPIQQAIVEEGGTQCGFCTVGFVVSLTGFSLSQKSATYENAIASIDGNICRCTGYKSLERAADRITQSLQHKNQNQSLEWLTTKGFIPKYFEQIPQRLLALYQQANGSLQQAQQKAVYVGGGTDLFVQRPEAMVHTPITPLLDQGTLKYIYAEEGNCYIGGAVTAEELQDNALMQQIFPDIRAYMKLVSSTPIRNMGTIAGNFVNASPIGDLTNFFLALDSYIVLNDSGKRRELPLKTFYLGYKKLDKTATEYIEAIYFKIPQPTDYFNFEKVCKRTHLDIASVNSSCFLQVNEDGIITQAHISAGGVGPIPMYLEQTRKALIGQKVHADRLQHANKILQSEISPISDARGSAAYKRLLLRQLFYAHFLTFFPNKINLKALIAV